MAYFDLGPYSRKITTSSPDAQLWFDRGLNWLFGFNHGEAIKCFQKALKHDPDCAMAHWGVSYASGPNYNLPWHLYDPSAGRWPCRQLTTPCRARSRMPQRRARSSRR